MALGHSINPQGQIENSRSRKACAHIGKGQSSVVRFLADIPHPHKMAVLPLILLWNGAKAYYCCKDRDGISGKIFMFPEIDGGQ